MRVLLVEDETRLAETVRRGLMADGCTVQVEHDGVAGLAAAAGGGFDVVVLDIMLPGKTGTTWSGRCASSRCGRRC